MKMLWFGDSVDLKVRLEDHLCNDRPKVQEVFREVTSRRAAIRISFLALSLRTAEVEDQSLAPSNK